MTPDRHSRIRRRRGAAPRALVPALLPLVWLALAQGALAGNADTTLAVQAAAPLTMASGAAPVAKVPEVGVVSLAIGDSLLRGADGRARAVERGARIRVGDRIETGHNGQVHLRFVDDGAVSVRPDSVLQVQDYLYDAARPELSEVRLKLEKGIGRSISGGATEVDKTRFRLNTPIAAIGVRGTDFIVQAQPDAVRAMVADGAIVMAPYGAQCSAAGLGPCAGGDARELSAEMGRWVAEVRPGDAATRLVRADDAGEAAGKQPSTAAAAAARSTGLLAAEPTSNEMQRGNDRAAAEMLHMAAVQVPELNRPPALDAKLVWGRWTIYPAAGDKLTIPYALARLGRHITVADYGAGLFRSDGFDSNKIFGAAGAGPVEFRLTHAEANHESAAGITAAKVNAANLTIDFGRRNFATALDLTSASGVAGQVRASGQIRNDGLFVAVDPTQKLAGALSGDGREAGYSFESWAGSDVFRGRTLWGRGP